MKSPFKVNMHLVKYYMDSCAPCKELDKVLSQVDLGGITYESLDIFQQDRLEIQRIAVRGAPTMILYEDGSKQTEIKRITGSMSKKQLEVWLGLT